MSEPTQGQIETLARLAAAPDRPIAERREFAVFLADRLSWMKDPVSHEDQSKGEIADCARCGKEADTFISAGGMLKPSFLLELPACDLCHEILQQLIEMTVNGWMVKRTKTKGESNET